MTNRIYQFETDNRDLSETWLHLPDGTIVQVDPIKLFQNALENAVHVFAEVEVKVTFKEN